ncbi:MAG: YgiQ family radical SAM protein [Candidatus Izemoplasmatales bacterium]
MPYLPISKEEMLAYGISEPDFIFVSGDAYCDHPSFGTAIIARLLERHGFSVCILSQPDVYKEDSFLEFGKPRLGWLVSSGNIDSMVNHYSVSKRRRKVDYYTPGGIMGKRPDRAVIKYSQVIRNIDPHAPIILGGIEASLRRLSHYDYWDDRYRKSVLLDSKADLLVYGMGELAILEIAEALKAGIHINDIIYVNGTVFKTKNEDYLPYNAIRLPSFHDVIHHKDQAASSFMTQYTNTDAIVGKPLVEEYEDYFVVQNSAMRVLTSFEMDEIYSLPFMRDAHPELEKLGHIKAMDEIKFSLTANRGCFGGCSFCALTMHQGRMMTSRSKESLVDEARLLISDPEFKGYIHDVGGPTANFYHKACDKQENYGVCKTKQCLHPTPCKSLKVDHQDYLDILRSLRELDGVKKVFVRSGIRYDYLMYDKDDTFFHELLEHHVSGQLKVAPEHVSSNVLDKMGKPSRKLYDEFVQKFYDITKSIHKEQYLVPYLMSSHPGSSLDDAIILAEYIRDMGYNPEQVQDFYPTPMTLSTMMYYLEKDPRDGSVLYVAKTAHDKSLQRALIQYRNPKNYDLVYEALSKAKRFDLIGYEKNCLIRPKKAGSR